jgi:threonine synthase
VTEAWDARRASLDPRDVSGVWRFRELVLDLPAASVVTRGEGNTTLYTAPAPLAEYAGLERLRLKHEGENPTGSFKDRGMTVAVSMARHLGRKAVACASTGNTSASMASYAAMAGLEAFVFLPAGKIASGKLAQAIAYGAHTLQLAGDFDDAMREVEALSEELGVYLVNSVNPFRIEGQKAIMAELLQQCAWDPPDWVVVPGGNLGNTSAFGKAFEELRAAGVISRCPRLAVIQAAGAAPFHAMVQADTHELVPVQAETVATAIRIGNPVSWPKALHALQVTDGVVERVTDEEILAAKARVDGAGIGAEPASCASVAGIRKLRAAGVIGEDEDVVAILTGHVLKDTDCVVRYHLEEEGPGRNKPLEVAAEREALRRAVKERLGEG